jgi:ABC-2 type transport system ATP-binding protein
VTNARAIETRDLTRRFGDHIVVDRLNLTVEPSEVYGFVGPNGAGKTTTIRMLLGLIAGSSGEIDLLGRRVTPGSVDLAGIGAIVDKPGFYPHLSGMDNLDVLTRTRHASIPRTQLIAAIELAGLDRVDRRPVRHYSTGMRQRLALACALASEPELVILDEPTDGLDPVGIADLRGAIQRLASNGVTVFLSSHLLSEVERICTRIGVLVNGKLVREGPPDEIARSEGREGTLEEAFLDLARPTDRRQ